MTEGDIGVAFVEVPPCTRPHENTARDASQIARGKLSGEKEWFVMTPAVALVKDGLVRAAWKGKAPKLDVIMKHILEESIRLPGDPPIGVAERTDRKPSHRTE